MSNQDSTQNVPALRLDGFEGKWDSRPIASMAEVITGTTPPTRDTRNYGEHIPFLGPADLEPAREIAVGEKYLSEQGLQLAREIPPGATLLVCIGSIGKVGQCSISVTTNQQINAVIPSDSRVNDFLFTRIESAAADIIASSSTQTMPIINKSKLESVPLDCPPTVEEQQAIGAVFTNLDATIDQHTNKHRVLQRTKTALMQKMFPQDGQTEPELRLDGFGGEWLADPIKRIAPLQRGFDLPQAQIRGGSVPVVMSNGVQYRHDTAQAKGPGVVTGRSGTIGKVQYIHEDYWPHNTTLWVTDFHGNDPKFIFYLFETIDLKRFASGSGVPTLNRNDVHDHVSAVPPTTEEQQAIGAVFNKLDTLISAEVQFIEKLTQTKTTLLQKMFV